MGGNSGSWATALGVSVLIHAVLIFFAVSFGKSDPGKRQDAEDTPPPAANRTEDEKSREKKGPQPPVNTSSRPAERSDPGPETEIYVIKQGDTITKIAKAYGVAPEDIAKANGKTLSRMNVIWVGQKIKIPKQDDSTARH